MASVVARPAAAGVVTVTRRLCTVRGWVCLVELLSVLSFAQDPASRGADGESRNKFVCRERYSPLSYIGPGRW